MKKKRTSQNLLDLIPIQNVEWTNDEKDLVVLLKPKFSNRLLVKYLLPRMKSPHYKINLDIFGSYVWNSCDGKNTVSEIAARLKKKFGAEIEPVYERLSLFIKTLEKNKFIYYSNMIK